MEASKRSGPGPGDGELVARAVDGERHAFGLLVDRHQAMLYRHALRLTGQPDTAADLVQNACVKAFVQLRSCRDPDRFGAWLFRILSNQAKDWLKNRRRLDVPLEQTPLSALAQSDDDPAADLERSELRAVLDAALAQLPDGLREAFVLKHEEGLEYDAMSELLGVSVSALKMRVHRARALLQTALQEAR